MLWEKDPCFKAKTEINYTKANIFFFLLQNKHIHPPLTLIIMGRTCQLKWGKLAANALRARSVSRGRRSLHRSAEDETNVAAELLAEPTASEGRRATELHLNAGLWANRRDLNTSAAQWCYGNQCWFWHEVQKKKRCVTIATASFQHKLSVPSMHVPLYISPTPRLLCRPTFVVSIQSCQEIQILQAKTVQHRKTQTQVAHSTAHTDGRTPADLRQTCILTFLPSLPLSPRTLLLWRSTHWWRKKRTTNNRTRTCPRLRLTWHLAETNRKHQNILFFFFFLKTVASLKAYSQQHEPRGQRTNIKQQKKNKKTTLLWIHYWEEWVSWLTGIKGTEAALSVWSQRGAATATASPSDDGETNLENESRGQESQHTHKSHHLRLPLPLHL